MYKQPTQAEIDAIMQAARMERARIMREGLIWMGQQFAAPFKAAPKLAGKRTNA